MCGFIEYTGMRGEMVLLCADRSAVDNRGAVRMEIGDEIEAGMRERLEFRFKAGRESGPSV